MSAVVTEQSVDPSVEQARAAAGAVLDPEVPVLTIADLGVLRDVEIDEHRRVTVTITPTYSGCPAMDVIRRDVEDAVRRAGFADVVVRTVLAPAWTTDWMTEQGKAALAAYGIAPPEPRTTGPVPVTLSVRRPPPPSVRCPQCQSPDTRELSRFGSTACKSLWVCGSCREPFDYFKAL